MVIKLKEIDAIIIKHDFDVFCRNEIWSGEKFKNNGVDIHDYDIDRKDRYDDVNSDVFIYLRNHVSVESDKNWCLTKSRPSD